MMLPRIVRQMLMGREPQELRRKRHPARMEPTWRLEPDARHPSEGHFEVSDELVTPAPPVVAIEPVDAEAAAGLAAEARRLIASDSSNVLTSSESSSKVPGHDVLGTPAEPISREQPRTASDGNPHQRRDVAPLGARRVFRGF